ncbi:MAG: TolB family protein [Planctomycetota bacterium]
MIAVDAAIDAMVVDAAPECEPTDEICNDADDDCDGRLDEGLGKGGFCQPDGECGGGELECDDEGGVRCSTAPGGTDDESAAEICDDLDNDCDGEADEDPEMLSAPCYSGNPAELGVGACRAGTRACLAGGILGDCEGEIGPSRDICNGIDDDCDGALDEAFEPEGCGVGLCAALARPSQCDGGDLIPCTPGEGDVDDATCDGVDDDCDGEVDEDYAPVAGCGEGACGAAATPSSCVGGVETPCQPGAAADNDSTCDGVDDDCDGETDEDYQAVVRCGTGACADNATPSSCTEGVETPCAPAMPAADDAVCDGEDADCDGRTDEDYVVVDTCGVGACADAATPSSCVGGIETACAPGDAAADDAVCDGVDSDCDEAVDEDYVVVAECGVGACRADATPSSCVDGGEIACAPGDEGVESVDVCDGVDEDCDGRVDEAVEPTAEDTRVSEGDFTSIASSLAWNGDGYGVAWQDARAGNAAMQIRFRQLDADGATETADTQISTIAGAHREPSLAWTGVGYGVVWSSNSDVRVELFFSAVSAAGAKVGVDRKLTTGFAGEARRPSLVFDGAGFAVAWQDTRNNPGGGAVSPISDIYFGRFTLNQAGEPIFSETRVTTTDADSVLPSLVRTDTGYAVAWTEIGGGTQNIMMQRLTVGGVLDGDPIAVTDTDSTSSTPSLAWNGNGYGVAWQDTRSGQVQIWFQEINANGGLVNAAVRVSQDNRASSAPSLVWNGDGYGVAWQDGRNVSNFEIWFSHLGLNGVPSALGDVQISNAPGLSFTPSLVWTGARYGAAWDDRRIANNNAEIYFTSGPFGCP